MIAPCSLRIWYAFVGILLWIAIYLTGFSQVHWLLFLPAFGFIFSSITGLCFSQMAFLKMYDVKPKETTNPLFRQPFKSKNNAFLSDRNSPF